MDMTIDLTNNQGGELGAEVSQSLENDIYKLLIKGELLLDENPKEALESFYLADSLYRWHGYDFRIECMINDMFFECIDKDLIPEV